MEGGELDRASKEQRHHYVPEFYMRQWVGDDGRLCQIHRPRDRLVAERVPPKRTGYQRGLYAIPGVPPEKANEIEDTFLRRVDQEAADVLDIFLNHPTIEIPTHLRHGWARFIMTMMQRHPVKVRENTEKAKQALIDEIERFRADWVTLRQPGEPEDFEEALTSLDDGLLDRFGALALRKLGDLPNVGEAICRMQWHAVELTGHVHKVLTSDRPVVMSNGLAKPEAHIVMPLSPDVIFVATKREIERRRIDEMLRNGTGVSELNDRVVRQAHRFVYGVDDRQLRFIENRIGPHFRSRD